MPTKRKTKRSPKNVSVYDSFLRQEIEMASSPFEVYKESRLRLPTQSLPKDDHTTDQDGAESTALDGHVAKTRSKKSNQAFNSENQSEFKTSLSSQIWQAINSPVVWWSVTISSVLGVILFYFQGLQPLLLTNYAEQVKSQIGSMQLSLSQQVGAVSEVQNDLLMSFSYDLSTLCGENQKYQNRERDIQSIERIKVVLMPRLDFQKAPTYRNFYDQDIKSSYDSVFAKYTASLTNIQKSVSDLALWPNFLTFRNGLIESCSKIEKAGDQLSKLKPACQEMTELTNTYNQGSKPSFWSQVETYQNNLVKYCQIVADSKGVSFSGYSTWKLEWLSSFEKLASFRPDLKEVVALINSKIEDFAKTSSSALIDINEIVTNKTEFTKLWYLMQFGSK
jgi:hypothetical protein